MTDFLVKRFIKNSTDVNDPAVRTAYGNLAGAVGIFCNVLLCAAKLAVGTLFGSISITADAVNNLSDASSSVITLVGFRLSAKPADDEHPYGHARIEYLAGLAVSVMILVIGVELARSSIGKILSPTAVEFSLVTVAVLLLSIGVKLWMAAFNKKVGRRIGSAALEATAMDSRNDVISTAAVLAGGVFNVFGDYFFVFTCDMGVFGAGLATAIGSGITFTVMLSHFFSRCCTLRPVRFRNAGTKLWQILTTGFSTFFLDIAMGILTMLFNRQILQGLGTDALAVYGVIVNVSTMIQCCAYSVGQAAQPILSASFGAGKWGRIRAALKYALMAAAFFSAVWTLLVFLFPNGFIRIFMSPTGDILRIAPAILRSYGVSFLLLPLNIFSTYYFQSLMKPRASFSVSVLRGLVLSGALINALPALLGPGAVWFAMPVTEAVTAVGVCMLIVRYTRPAPQTPE